MKKKLVTLFMVLTLIGSTISISADEDGAVINNPWESLFKGTQIKFDAGASVLSGSNGASATMEVQGNAATVHITSTGTPQGDASMDALQIKGEKVNATVGEKYKYSATLLSEKNKEVVIKVISTDGNGTVYSSLRVQLEANQTKNISIDNIAPTMNGMQIIYELGTMGTESAVTEFDILLKNSLMEGRIPADIPTSEITTSEVTTSEVTTSEVTTSEVTTSEVTSNEVITGEVTTAEAATVDGTTAEITTTEIISSEATTATPTTTEPSTTGSQSTTKAQSTTANVEKQVEEFQKKCGVAKVKIASKTKKSAKRVKVVLKKNVNGADGLVVRFYKTRKQARMNKNAIKEFVVKKNPKTFVLKNKKLKSAKLFIRVCGFKQIGEKRYYAKKWSVTKSVKIKK